MKKFALDKNTAYYLFRDNLAVLKRYPSGETKFVPLPMSDVDDSELWKNPEVAEWVNGIARKALEVRDEHGKVVGIDKSALSFDEMMLAGIWGKIQNERAERADANLPHEEMDDDADLSPEAIESLREYVQKKAASLTPEQKARILKNLEECRDDDTIGYDLNENE